MSGFVDGFLKFYYENGNPAIGFTINRNFYGNSNFPSCYYEITLPEPGTLAGDKIKLVFEKYQK